jgi:epoxyqueuosine reductase QueG
MAQLHSAYATSLDSLDVLEVLGWDEEARRKAFQGSALKRAKLGMIRRNAVIVAGNILSKSDDEDLLQKLQAIAADDSDDLLVRNAAQVVLGE